MILGVVFAPLCRGFAVIIALCASTATTTVTTVTTMTAMTKQMHADKYDRDQNPNPIL